MAAIGKSDQVRRQRFAKEFFAQGCNGLRAYMATWNCSERVAHVNAPRLMQDPGVQALLQTEYQALTQRLEAQQDRALLELCSLAYSSMTNVASWGEWGMSLKDSETLPPEVAASVERVRSHKTTRTMKDGSTVEDVQTDIKLHSKTPALSALQEYFKRGDPLSAEAEAKLQALVMIMAQYVDSSRLAAFRAHVAAAFGFDIPGSADGRPAPRQLTPSPS